MKIFFLKLLLKSFCYHGDAVYSRSFTKWTSSKGNDMFYLILLKVDYMYSLLRKSLWKIQQKKEKGYDQNL